MKGTYVRARITEELKSQSEDILAELGFTMSQAIILMLKQTVIQGKLPFEIHGAPVLNARALAVMKHSDDHPEDVIKHASSKAFFESLGIGDTPKS